MGGEELSISSCQQLSLLYSFVNRCRGAHNKELYKQQDDEGR